VAGEVLGFFDGCADFDGEGGEGGAEGVEVDFAFVGPFGDAGRVEVVVECAGCVAGDDEEICSVFLAAEEGGHYCFGEGLESWFAVFGPRGIEAESLSFCI